MGPTTLKVRLPLSIEVPSSSGDDVQFERETVRPIQRDELQRKAQLTVERQQARHDEEQAMAEAEAAAEVLAEARQRGQRKTSVKKIRGPSSVSVQSPTRSPVKSAAAV